MTRVGLGFSISNGCKEQNQNPSRLGLWPHSLQARMSVASLGASYMGVVEFQREFYGMLMRSQHWPAEQMGEYQRTLLIQLLWHAKKHVPFYETRLDAVLKANGDVNWDRWGEIPILRRTDLIDHRDAMQARELPEGHGPVGVAHSSGSSGRPVSISVDATAELAGDAALARAHAWHEVDFNKRYINIGGTSPTKGAWPNGTFRGKWGPAFLRDQTAGEAFGINVLASPAEQLEFLQRLQPSYLGGLTSRMLAVAHEAERQGVTLDIEMLFARGEAVSDRARELFKRVFGARVLSSYAAQETNKIAHECPAHRYFHINAEVNFIEIVDGEGHPSRPGETGSVIATSLHNFAQPIIRYELGDIASFVAEETCRHQLPKLSQIDGRIVHLFVLPDGVRFQPNLSDDDAVLLGAKQWQMAQVSPSLLELRFVPALDAVQDAEKQFFELLRPRIDSRLDFRVIKLERFIHGPGQKHIPYVNEMTR